MRQTKRRIAVFGLALLSLVAGPGGAGREAESAAVSAYESENVATGMWGGDQVRMHVTEEGASIEHACARGRIEHRLATEAGGRFTAKGTYHRERGGPEREREERGEPAVYTGRTDGKTMTLTVRLTRTDEKIGPFTLVYGKNVRMTKCL